MTDAAPAGTLRVGLVQLTGGPDPAATLPAALAAVDAAAAGGARLIATPEVTNLIGTPRARLADLLHPEHSDPTLAALRDRAARHGVWLLVGSLALRAPAESGRLAVNRALLLAPDGAVAARYDKIHLFDVALSDTETVRESATFAAGNRAVLAAGPVPLGLTICYDLRFPQLFRALARAGARIIAVPAAFSPTTGPAHWEVLLRARAIETGCFILAPAQTGTHPGAVPPRASHGHSLIVDPWGAVLADAGTAPGVILHDLDLAAVDRARARVPALDHDRPFAAPDAP